jgi:hypothetical protein
MNLGDLDLVPISTDYRYQRATRRLSYSRGSPLECRPLVIGTTGQKFVVTVK